MNPGSKVLLSLFFILVTLLSDGWKGYPFLVILVWLLIRAAGVKIRTLYRGVKPLLMLILFTVILQTLLDSKGRELWRWGPFNVTQGGLTNGMLLAVRLTLIVIVSTVLTLSTPPMAIAGGIERLLFPLEKLKVPVDVIALMISVSLRFVPALTDEFRIIVKAQQARGMDYRTGSLLDRIRKVTGLLIPLLFSSLNRAQSLGDAMISRGYRGDGSHHREPLHARDFTAWLIFLVLGGLALFFG